MSFSWQNLPKPIVGLSPMDGITDHAFRHIHAKYGRPDIMMTEFTNVEGLILGKEVLLENFLYDETQRPIIAQIYGATPAYFYKATVICCELGFDAIDINMGCPAKNVAHQGGGAALIADPPRAKDIVRHVKKAVEDWTNGLTIKELELSEEKNLKIEELKKQIGLTKTTREKIPVSVKTRIGIQDITVEEWVKHLLETEPANITIHGRTLKQMYTGQANWEAIAKAATIIKQTNTTVIGNGDILSVEQGIKQAKTAGTDGFLIGRAAMGNPHIWHGKNGTYIEPTPIQKLEYALEHAKIHADTKPEKIFLHMRKHFSFYITNFPHANEIKVKLVQTKTFLEAEKILREAIEALPA